MAEPHSAKEVEAPVEAVVRSEARLEDRLSTLEPLLRSRESFKFNFEGVIYSVIPEIESDPVEL